MLTKASVQAFKTFNRPNIQAPKPSKHPHVQTLKTFKKKHALNTQTFEHSKIKTIKRQSSKTCKHSNIHRRPRGQSVAPHKTSDKALSSHAIHTGVLGVDLVVLRLNITTPHTHLRNKK